jgi:hypothetical protein
MTRQRWKQWKRATKPLKAAQSQVLMEELSMETNRRQFVKANLLGGLTATLPLSAICADAPRSGRRSQNPRYAKLDEILGQPVLKRELFATPVIIETLCTPHMSGGGLGFLYMMHFVSALPNALPHHEFKGLRTSVQFECKTSPLKVVDGRIGVPTGPGLAADIDPAYVNKHQTVRA